MTNYQSTGASMDNIMTSFVCTFYDLATVVVAVVAVVAVVVVVVSVLL